MSEWDRHIIFCTVTDATEKHIQLQIVSEYSESVRIFLQAVLSVVQWREDSGIDSYNIHIWKKRLKVPKQIVEKKALVNIVMKWSTNSSNFQSLDSLAF